MNIFPTTPKLTQQDRDRLTATGILDRWTTCSRRLNEHNLGVDDLKRLIIMESERDFPRENIRDKLIVKLQKKERGNLIKRINALTRKTA